MKKAATVTGSIVGIVVLAWFALAKLVDKPLSVDLSRVGQGKPALVLAFENYSGPGMMAMDLINKVRDDYEPEVEFLVADLGRPEGAAFARRHGLHNGTGVLLDADGARISRHALTISAEELRRQLDRNLKRAPVKAGNP